AGNITTMIDLEKARDESRTLASRIIDRGAVQAADGWWLGGNLPFGYCRMEYSSDGKELGILKRGVHAREGNRVRPVLDRDPVIDAVRHIFESYVHGDSLNTLVDWLNRKGFTTTRGSKWSRTVVQNMLKNPIFRGDHSWGKRKQGVFSRGENLWHDRQQSWSHDRDKWITHHDEKLRIVSDEVFFAVQEKMKNNSREYSGEKRPDKFALLDRLVYCENCDSR
ncbi:recombinase family protein, partial [Candidatus Neomarinimicrobiota bacterium]